MNSLALILAIAACLATSYGKPSGLFPAPLVAPAAPVAYAAAPFVTRTAQVYQTNFNTLAAPVFGRYAYATPAVAAPFVAAPAAVAAPAVAAPAVAAPLVAGPAPLAAPAVPAPLVAAPARFAAPLPAPFPYYI